MLNSSLLGAVVSAAAAHDAANQSSLMGGPMGPPAQNSAFGPLVAPPGLMGDMQTAMRAQQGSMLFGGGSQPMGSPPPPSSPNGNPASSQPQSSPPPATPSSPQGGYGDMGSSLAALVGPGVNSGFRPGAAGPPNLPIAGAPAIAVARGATQGPKPPAPPNPAPTLPGSPSAPSSPSLPNLAVRYQPPSVAPQAPNFSGVPAIQPGTIAPDPSMPAPDAGNGRISLSDIQSLLASRPPDDPRIASLFDTANILRAQAYNLAPPKYPGMSIGQALLGIAGAIATQNNPHAQFVQNYLPALADAVQKQYGNTEQAWQAAREGLLSQAQAMANQAGAMQNYNAEIYKANVGPYGRGITGLLQDQKGVDVANIQANNRAAVAQLQANPRLAGDAINLILKGDPSSKMQGYSLLQTIPGFPKMTPDQMDAALQSLSPAQQLQMARASKAASDANAVNTLLPFRKQEYGGRFAEIMAATGLKTLQGQTLDDLSQNWAAKTAALPEDLLARVGTSQAALENAVTNSYLARAQADKLAALRGLGSAPGAADAARGVIGSAQSAATELLRQAGSLGALKESYLAQLAQSTDPDEQSYLKAKVSTVIGAIQSLNQQAKAVGMSANIASGRLASLQNIPTPASSTPSTATGTFGSNGSGGQTAAPQASQGAPRASTGSNAVNSANAQLAGPIVYRGPNPNALAPGTQTPVGKVVSDANKAIAAGQISRQRALKALAAAQITGVE